MLAGLFRWPALVRVRSSLVRVIGAPGQGDLVMILFLDRTHAGLALAQALAEYKGQDVVVLALPRGGVPLAFEIARALCAPLDLVLVRKIGAPGFEELAIGAIADGQAAELVTDPDLIRRLNVPPEWIEETRIRETVEMERRRRVYLQGRKSKKITGRIAILVDDGLATGATMLAALRATRRSRPARLIVAVPIGAPEAIARIRAEADVVVCLHAPPQFGSVGEHYRHFPQLQDEEVITLLDEAAARCGRNPSSGGGGGATESSPTS